MTYYEPHEQWNTDLQVMTRTEVYTFPGFDESVTCTYYGHDPDPSVDHAGFR